MKKKTLDVIIKIVKIKTFFKGSGIRIALLVGALAIVGFMQFIWFSRAAIADIDNTHHSLASAGNQAFLREFQRYSPLFGLMRELADDATPNDAKQALASLFAVYGPAGSAPDLAASVSIASWAEPSRIETLGSDGVWKPRLDVIDRFMTGTSTAELSDGNLVIASDPKSNDRQYLLIRAGATSVAIVEIDTERFFDTYVKPAIAAALPGATISWDDQTIPNKPYSASANSRNDNEHEKSQFNPLLALLGIESKKTSTFYISVPATMDLNQLRRITAQEAGKVGTSEPNYRFLQGGDNHGIQNDAKKRFARIVMPKGSTAASMELRLSLNWLLSILFLVGIGLAFAQTILQKAKLKAVSEREREFVASVTHELRTPVTAIKSAAYNMREGLVGPERMNAYGAMIHSESVRLASMIEEMLLFSQVEGRKAPPPVSGEIETLQFLGELRQPLDEIALHSGIHIVWNFGAMPERFLGAADILHNIVTNLVSNALNHAYTGGDNGEIRVIGRISMPDTLQFIVEDDGRGIAKAEAKLVFEPFYRDERSRAMHEKGSGLGLFIAKREAEILGGNLSLETPYKRITGTKKNGCRFLLELPLKERNDAE